MPESSFFGQSLLTFTFGFLYNTEGGKYYGFFINDFKYNFIT